MKCKQYHPGFESKSLNPFEIYETNLYIKKYYVYYLVNLVSLLIIISQKISTELCSTMNWLDYFTWKYYKRWNDKIVVLKKTTLQLYFKTFIEKIILIMYESWHLFNVVAFSLNHRLDTDPEMGACLFHKRWRELGE